MRQAWTVLASEVLFAAPPYVVVTRECVRTSRGVEVDDFYRVDLPNFVVCVPQTSNGEIVTLWSYKHGPRRWGLSFPAGFLAQEEAPEAACRRELVEETGYTATELLHLGAFVDNGNQRGSLGNYFAARDCKLVATPASGDHEEIEVRLMSPHEIDCALSAGDIPVVHHVAAWGLARTRLGL